MDEGTKEIYFTVIEAGTKREIKTRENEYRNLMMLLNDKIYFENFGECGGMGRCATCVVRVSGNDELLNSGYDRNERSTLDKMDITEKSLRLSCQILINTSLNNSTIRIEEQIY